MLTKTDLSQIRQVVREEVENEIKTAKDDLRSEIKLMRIRIEERLYGIEDKVKNLDIEMRKEFKIIKKDISKIKKDINVMIDMFDRQDVSLHKRVDKIEKHLNFASLE